MLKFFFSLDRIEDVMQRYIDLPPDKRFRYDINRLVYFITSLPNLVVINTILYNNLKKRKKKKLHNNNSYCYGCSFIIYETGDALT